MISSILNNRGFSYEWIEQKVTDRWNTRHNSTKGISIDKLPSVLEALLLAKKYFIAYEQDNEEPTFEHRDFRSKLNDAILLFPTPPETNEREDEK
jgi:hypothetical protein